MTLQYARFYALYSAIRLIGNEEADELEKDRLIEELVVRKDLQANPDKESGARDLIFELERAYLLTEDVDGYRLTTSKDLPDLDLDEPYLYPGMAVYESIRVNDRVEANNRILTSLIYAHPELLTIALKVYKRPNINEKELKRQLNGEAPFGNNLNNFTLNLGIKLLSDANVVKEQDSMLVSGMPSLSVFARILYEEFVDNGGVDTALARKELFGSMQMKYDIDRDTFDRHLNRLEQVGLVSRGSYESITIDDAALQEVRIHE